ncbi:MAG: M23 family metallopeptidase [Proteobacteria bacterium]|jgi:murein DD-endopeptidase|nr:M23 family metallopeptidase [Pseudomonadota bacterium]
MRMINPPGGLPWALYALCGSSLVLNVVLLAKLMTRPTVEVEPDTVVEALAEPEVIADVEAQAENGEALAEPEAAPAAVVPEGVIVVKSSVEHSLARTFQNAVVDEHADVVAAIYARLFFWKLDLRRDLQKGDQVAVAYEWVDNLAEIPVASYESKKLGSTLKAYQYHASGDAFPSWWDEEGNEVSYRLKDSPLDNYQQITSLLKDRPSHRGIDFKTPVGTELVSPRSGKVTRVNWNMAYNGSCIELRYRDGTVAKFLHLSEALVKAGQSVGPGAKLGLTGNSGRSTAPHLHYELQKNDKIVDPVDYHGVTQRSLSAEDRAQFLQDVARLDLLLNAAS